MPVPAGAADPYPDHAILPGLGKGGSLQAVLHMRWRQIHEFGHTPDEDDKAPNGFFAQQAIAYACDARDIILNGSEHWRKDARGKLVRCAALCLAGIDRLDRMADDGEGE